MTQNLASLAVGISTSVTLSILLKATAIAAAGLLVANVMRHARAARRFIVLASTFAVLAAVPIVVALVPAVPVVVREIRPVTPLVSPEPVAVNPIEQGRQPAASPAAAAPDAINAGRLGTLALMLWGIGTVVSLVPVLVTLWRLRTLRMTARVWNHSGLCNVGPQVLIHERVTAPITFGWWRPYVLLPTDAETWPMANVHRALVHEMEHVARRDWLVHVFARFVCAVYWFHPLVWMAWRQLHLEADRACDDAVVSKCDAREFAEQLIALAGRIRSGAPAPALSMAGGDLVTRVKALLNQSQARGRSGSGFAIATTLAAFVVGTGITILEAEERIILQPALRSVSITLPVAAQADRPAPSVRPAPREGAAATQPPPSPGAAAAPGDYVIGIGDVLTITVWREEELTGDYVVRPDGKITVPFLDDVAAARLTPEQLRDRLMDMSARILARPRITVAVKEINSRKVYILGGVVTPGPYDLVGPMSVIHLISAAGGLEKSATGSSITILRDEDGSQTRFRFNYRELISGQNLQQNIVLKPGDTVIVPE